MASPPGDQAEERLVLISWARAICSAVISSWISFFGPFHLRGLQDTRRRDMTIRCLLLAFTLLILPLSSTTGQDWKEFSEAYERGDYATVIELVRPLAEQGDAEAQSLLGFMHYHGEGVPQDYAEARLCLVERLLKPSRRRPRHSPISVACTTTADEACRNGPKKKSSPADDRRTNRARVRQEVSSSTFSIGCTTPARACRPGL